MLQNNARRLVNYMILSTLPILLLSPNWTPLTLFMITTPYPYVISYTKIISKIIANNLKPIISAHISLEQFAFLHHCHIHEAISTAQEAFHSIKTNHIKGIILKLDLENDFNHSNWISILMLLTNLGFPLLFINWIMCCITNVSFSVLINGSASPLFHSERGLQKGCQISPLQSNNHKREETRQTSRH